MGYTNKTSHYELPQYVANDKPSWLGDFNAAMLKIDTVMADNDATAEAANSAATGAQTQVAALSAQLGTIQGQVNTAIDTATTADGKATTAQTVAGEANTNASEAKTLAGEAKTLAQSAKQTADNALPISGGTMTGYLILNGEPATDNQAATKAYVDAHSATVNYTETTTTKHTNVTLSSIGKLYVYGKYVEIGMPNAATYSAINQVGSGTLLMPFAQMNGNPCSLSVDAYKQFGTMQRTRANQNTFTAMYAYYDGSKTYICTRNAQINDVVIKIAGGLLVE